MRRTTERNRLLACGPCLPWSNSPFSSLPHSTCSVSPVSSLSSASSSRSCFWPPERNNWAPIKNLPLSCSPSSASPTLSAVSLAVLYPITPKSTSFWSITPPSLSEGSWPFWLLFSRPTRCSSSTHASLAYRLVCRPPSPIRLPIDWFPFASC